MAVLAAVLLTERLSPTHLFFKINTNLVVPLWGDEAGGPKGDHPAGGAAKSNPHHRRYCC